MNKRNLRTYEKVNKVINYLAIGWLWIIMCIPIFTIGASTTAAYSVVKKCLDNTEGYVFGQFFEAFKANFKLSTKAWLIILVALIMVVFGVLSFDSAFEAFADYKYLFMSVYTLEGILLFFVFLYVFPYIATFEDDLKSCLVNSFLISVKHMPYSIAAVLVLLLVAELGIRIYIVFILSPAVIIYANARIVRKVLLIYEQKS